MTLDHAIPLQNIQVTSKFATRSFNDKPVNESAVGPIGKELFEKEQDDLLSDLKDIPKKACDRRVSFVFSCMFFFFLWL
jgi:EH domain-containing protein 1